MHCLLHVCVLKCFDILNIQYIKAMGRSKVRSRLIKEMYDFIKLYACVRKLDIDMVYREVTING